MKQDLYTCDVCKKESDGNNWSKFKYYSLTKMGNIVDSELDICCDCSYKIRDFMLEYSKELLNV